MNTPPLNLAELRSRARIEPVTGELCAQVTHRADLDTKDGTPYIELELADASGSDKIKLWDNSAAYSACQKLNIVSGKCIRITATFSVNTYGINLKSPALQVLLPMEEAELFAGDEEANAKTWCRLKRHLAGIEPYFLGAFCDRMADLWERELRTAAAARSNHHSWRGGLLEHTVSMMDVAALIAPHYPEVCPGLLMAGVFFHDSFKKAENGYPARGFKQAPMMPGIMHGHIALGYKAVAEEWERQFGAQYPVLRDHLLHLILSHHGQRDWGSPIEPMTVEAFVLHYIDNLDAKVTSLRQSFRNPDTTPGICDGAKPLYGSVARPWLESAEAASIFAQEPRLPKAPTPDQNAIQLAWGLIANAGGGDWSRQTDEWREAAEQWRDRFIVKKDPAPSEPAVPEKIGSSRMVFLRDLRPMSPAEFREGNFQWHPGDEAMCGRSQVRVLGIDGGQAVVEELDAEPRDRFRREYQGTFAGPKEGPFPPAREWKVGDEAQWGKEGRVKILGINPKDRIACVELNGESRAAALDNLWPIPTEETKAPSDKMKAALARLDEAKEILAESPDHKPAQERVQDAEAAVSQILE